MKTLEQVTDAEWAALAATPVYFGHQSVGANIVDGVRELLTEHSRIPLRVVESGVPGPATGGTLVHSRIGENGDPAGKARDFARRLSRGLGPGGGIAMFKFCYVDFTLTTDVAAVFRAYRESVEQVRASHPAVRVVHFTTPLTVRREPFKDLIRGVLGKPRYADVDAIRHQYNRTLTAAYEGKEPVFDLAGVESTHPDGTRESHRHNGGDVCNLVPAYTDDGGHLNALGRRRVAEALLVMLARVAGNS